MKNSKGKGQIPAAQGGPFMFFMDLKTRANVSHCHLSFISNPAILYSAPACSYPHPLWDKLASCFCWGVCVEGIRGRFNPPSVSIQNASNWSQAQSLNMFTEGTLAQKCPSGRPWLGCLCNSTVWHEWQTESKRIVDLRFDCRCPYTVSILYNIQLYTSWPLSRMWLW